VDADCTGATFCAPATLSCVARLGNGVAIPRDGLHDDGCLPGNGAAVCASGQCNPVTQTCSGAQGTACTSASECTIGVCGANGMCGQVAGKGPCDATSAPVLCQSGVCNVKLGLCKPTGTGGCLEDADCGADSFCTPSALTCTKKLAPGAPIPTDGAHTGVCSAATAQAVCASGLCNASANTCAAANGATCQSNDACVSAICPADGICGKATGGSCDRATECRSGFCTATICTRAAIGNGITVDDGCGCEVGGARGSGGLLIMTIAAARLLARRRRRRPPA
jgi:MYXO-CTERM domain-containing protein